MGFANVTLDEYTPAVCDCWVIPAMGPGALTARATMATQTGFTFSSNVWLAPARYLVPVCRRYAPRRYAEAYLEQGGDPALVPVLDRAVARDVVGDGGEGVH